MEYQFLWDMFPGIDLTFGKTSRSYTKYAKFKNWTTAQMWLNILVQRAEQSRYKIEGLDAPAASAISERVLKGALLYNGHASISLYDGFPIALPCTGAGKYNVNGDYLGGSVYGKNGYNRKVAFILPGDDPAAAVASGCDAVYIRETPREYPFFSVCAEFAEAIADTWRKIEVARSNAAVPFVVAADEQSQRSIIDTFRKRDENLPFLLLNRGILGKERMELFSINSTADAVKVFAEHVEWLLAQFDQLCGVEANANNDKAERMNVTETTSNFAGAEVMGQSCVASLNKYFEIVNKAFGLNLRAERGYVPKEQDEAVKEGIEKTAEGGEEEDGTADDVE